MGERLDPNPYDERGFRKPEFMGGLPHRQPDPNLRLVNPFEGVIKIEIKNKLPKKLEDEDPRTKAVEAIEAKRARNVAELEAKIRAIQAQIDEINRNAADATRQALLG